MIQTLLEIKGISMWSDVRHACHQFDGVGLLCVTHAINLMGLVCCASRTPSI